MSDFLNKLLDPKVQLFIKKNLDTDLTKLILKGSPFPNITVQELAVQIEGKKKTEKKLPKWFKTDGIIYPKKLNLEQSSSQITAKYKASLINKGTLIDLTGGFGIDDDAFAEFAEQVYHCEIDESLSAIVKHNSTILGKTNIQFIIGDSQTFLSKSKKVNIIYVDPSRRNANSRVFMFQDCEPDVLKNQSFYLQKADIVIIKAAPMLDIASALKLLKNVSQVHIVSVNNECKELLFIQEKNYLAEPNIFCAVLNQQEENKLQFKYSEEKALEIKSSALEKYLYEPDAAILKAGFFKSLTQKFPLQKLNPNTHLYTSSQIVNRFLGKIFEIIEIIDFNIFSTSKTTKKANVVTRNFHLKPEEIKKEFKIKDGGTDFLFFTTDYKELKKVIWCKRI